MFCWGEWGRETHFEGFPLSTDCVSPVVCHACSFKFSWRFWLTLVGTSRASEALPREAGTLSETLRLEKRSSTFCKGHLPHPHRILEMFPRLQEWTGGMKHISLATKLSSSKHRCRETCSCLPSDRGHCRVALRLWPHISSGEPGSCAEGARPSGRKLPQLGSEQNCNETSQPNSLFLPGAYKAQMCSDVWTNTKKRFLKRKSMSSPLFQQKAACDESGVQESWVSHLEAFRTQL